MSCSCSTCTVLYCPVLYCTVVPVVHVLGGEGDQRQEDADEDDDEDSANVVDADTARVFLVLLAALICVDNVDMCRYL